MKTKMKADSAFSLVEVLLAIGIISFVIVGLLALCSTTLDRVKYSVRDTIWVNIAQGAISQLRTTPWNEVGETNYFYNADGFPVSSATNSAVYECSVRRTSSIPVGLPEQASPYFSGWIIKMSWPVGAAKTNEIILPVAVAEYE